MLKFNTWPPEFEQVEWSASGKEALRWIFASKGTADESRAEAAINTMGTYIGDLLATNMIPGEVTPARVAIELTQGWDHYREAFMAGVERGVDLV